MSEQENKPQRPVNPRRRKKTKLQIFKESYLPVILAALFVFLIIAFIVGSISRSNDKREDEKNESLAAQQSENNKKLAEEQEAAQLIMEADRLAAALDYDGAIAKLDSFSGLISDYDILVQKRAEYQNAKDTMVLWNDPSKVTNLSIHLLIADVSRAFNHSGYGQSFKWNFLTIGEFTAILQQLYDNGYVLVNMDDVITETVADDGTVTYTPAEIYLPAGKKPLILTQTQVNYYTYMTDSDSDGLPDANGGGFASKLVVDENGEIACELVTSSGETVVGAYDVVPILNAFIEQNPGFSYQGAKAILAVSGYDGIFGYRTDPETEKKIGKDFYQQQLEGAKTIVEALRADGYTIACYTYDNKAYGDLSVEKLKEDVLSWQTEVAPLLGECDILVYAKNSDIAAPGEEYSGEKYETLRGAGFRYFLGFCEDANPWVELTGEYVRMGRLLVTGNSVMTQTELYTGMFEPKEIIDSKR